MNRVQRARGINQIMTGVFYLIAVFFFTLLIGFASYVIIKGFTGATPEMFAFARKGSIGNQLFNTIYLVFISLLFSIPLGVTAGIYLAMYAKKGFLTKFLRICIETLSSLPSIVVGLFGYLVFPGSPPRVSTRAVRPPRFSSSSMVSASFVYCLHYTAPILHLQGGMV